MDTELYKTRYLLLVYAICWAIYCWAFGMVSIRENFRVEPVIKLACTTMLVYAIFTKKENMFKFMCVVIFIVYGVFLCNLMGVIIRVFSSYPGRSITLDIKLFFDLMYKYGVDNRAGFEDIFITILPGLYYLIATLKFKKIHILFSVFIVLFAVLNIYYSIGYFVGLGDYWSKWGMDLLNPLQNTVIFRMLLDYIFFPAYVICNLTYCLKKVQ